MELVNDSKNISLTLIVVLIILIYYHTNDLNNFR